MRTIFGSEKAKITAGFFSRISWLRPSSNQTTSLPRTDAHLSRRDTRKLAGDFSHRITVKKSKRPGRDAGTLCHSVSAAPSGAVSRLILIRGCRSFLALPPANFRLPLRGAKQAAQNRRHRTSAPNRVMFSRGVPPFTKPPGGNSSASAAFFPAKFSTCLNAPSPSMCCSILRVRRFSARRGNHPGRAIFQGLGSIRCR